MEEFKRPKTHVEWLIGNSCNYRCSYCSDIFYKGTDPFPDQELFLKICTDIISHYDNLDRDVIFEFIGGEPSLLDKIPEIGNRLHNYPTNIILRTNGSASLDWWQKARRYFSQVVISVHREFCDITHIKNVINLLQDDTNSHPVDLKVFFPVTNRPESWNIGVQYVKEFREKFNVGDIQLLYSNFGKGSNTVLPYSEYQWNQYKELYNITESQSESSVRESPSYTNKTCYAGIDTLVIDSKGNIFRGWCNQGGIIGNIFEGEINLPQDPIVCQKDFCTNGFDQSAKKV